MPRLARRMAPGFPHHVTQRGNRRIKTFFGAEDCAAYRPDRPIEEIIARLYKGEENHWLRRHHK